MGFASTGTLLSLEAQTNLFMVSQAADQEALREWILDGCGARENEQRVTRISTEAENKVRAIAILRKNRTSYDQTINADAVVFRAEQANKNRMAKL